MSALSFYSPMLYPTGLYCLPETPRAEALRSRVLTHTRIDPAKYARKILQQQGRRDGNRLEIAGYIIALEPIYVPEFACFLDACCWIHAATCTRGYDLAELLAFASAAPFLHAYKLAIDALASHAGLDCAANVDSQYHEMRGHTQERDPIAAYVNWNLPLFPKHQEKIYAYFNKSGQKTAILMTYRALNNEVVRVYKTLWRSKIGSQLKVLEIFPQPPYQPYKENLLHLHFRAQIVFVANEELAEQYENTSQNTVFTTVPGGIRNVPDADLSTMKDRRVSVVMTNDDLVHAKLIEAKFRHAGVADLWFLIDVPSAKPMRLDELERTALRYGIDMRLPAAEMTLSDSAAPSALTSTDLGTFLSNPIPQRGYVLAPPIPEQGLVMIHAARGIGKTHAALGAACAIATGGTFLRWRAPKARRVLYIDGEMPAAAMQERLNCIAANGLSQPAEGFLRILSPDLLGMPMPDISTAEGQKALDPIIQDIDVIILDNLSTLCRSGNENGSDSWTLVQAWLLELRRRGKAVLIVHHSGKNGTQRGASRHEDILDTVIKLCRPQDYLTSQGARFEVHLEKARGIFGDDANPFEARLMVQDGKAIWETRDLVDPADLDLEDAQPLYLSGKSIREVAEELGISKSAAGRLRQQLVRDGRLKE